MICAVALEISLLTCILLGPNSLNKFIRFTELLTYQFVFVRLGGKMF